MNVFIREFLILFTYRLHFVAKRDTLEINICSQLGRSKVADTEHTKQKITIWIFFFTLGRTMLLQMKSSTKDLTGDYVASN